MLKNVLMCEYMTFQFGNGGQQLFYTTVRDDVVCKVAWEHDDSERQEAAQPLAYGHACQCFW